MTASNKRSGILFKGICLLLLITVSFVSFGTRFCAAEARSTENGANTVIDAAVNVHKLYLLSRGNLMEAMYSTDKDHKVTADALFSQIFESDKLYQLRNPYPEYELEYVDRYHRAKENYTVPEDLKPFFDRYYSGVDLVSEIVIQNHGYIVEENRLYLATGYQYWGFGGTEYYDYNAASVVWQTDARALAAIPHINEDYPEQDFIQYIPMIKTAGSWKASGVPDETPKILLTQDDMTKEPTAEELIDIAAEVLYYQYLVNKAGYGDLCGQTDVDLSKTAFYSWAKSRGYLPENSETDPVRRENVVIKDENGNVIAIRYGAIAFPAGITLASFMNDAAEVTVGDIFGWIPRSDGSAGNEWRYIFEVDGRLYHSLSDDGETDGYAREELLHRMEIVSRSDTSITIGAKNEFSEYKTVLFVRDGQRWKVAGGSLFGLDTAPETGSAFSLYLTAALFSLLSFVLTAAYLVSKKRNPAK
ncbi:MAG: hypothetical protein IJU52_04550 [Clostridia bacterium]|nr:hypothetical protein [Clostridia bacterium]